MASVPITINGRRYEIACDTGQEGQLSRLGRYVDDRVRQLSASVGPLGENKLLVMVSLLLADELSEKIDEFEAFKVENNAVVREQKDELLAQNLSLLARRITEMTEEMEEKMTLGDGPETADAPETT